MELMGATATASLYMKETYFRFDTHVLYIIFIMSKPTPQIYVNKINY